MQSQGISTNHRQHGLSTLVVAIVLLIAATFITFFAARVGIQEQRMTGNDARQKEAFATAEAGLDRAKAFLAANRQDFATWGWTNKCTGAEKDLPCGDGTNNLYNSDWSWINVFSRGAADYATNYLDGLNWPASTRDGPFILTQSVASTITPTTSFQPVVLVAQAESEDGSGRAVVRQSMTRFLIAQPGPVPPVMAPTVPLGGNFTVVGNPNHNLDPMQVTLANCDSLTGSGQMLSIWSEGAVPVSGTWKTCGLGSFRDTQDPPNRCIGPGIVDPVTNSAPTMSQCNCQPNAAEKSPYSGGSTGSGVGINEDVVDNDPDFPGDVFLYVFGRTKAAVKASAAAAGNLLPNCASLNASSTGLYWIEGDCDMPANSTIGSRAAPAIVVFEGNASFQSNSHAWGMVVGADMQRTCPGATPTDPYSVNSPCTSTDGTPNEVNIAGTFTIHGAMVVEGEIDGSGDYKAVYDPCVFAAMGAGTGFDRYGPVAGSWNDAL